MCVFIDGFTMSAGQIFIYMYVS